MNKNYGLFFLCGLSTPNRTKSSSYRTVAMNAFSGKKHNEKSGSQNQILFLESPANSSLLAGFIVSKDFKLTTPSP